VLSLDNRASYGWLAAAVECDLDRITVNYEIFGEGRPIIMLHGWPLDHTQMIYEMEPAFELRKGWRRYYPDMPGFGRTSGAEWITKEEQLLEVVEDFIDKIIPGERFVAAGTSYGAYVVEGLIFRRGAMMDGALLNVPVIIPDKSKRTLPTRTVILQAKSIIDRAKSENMGWLEQYVVAENETVLDYARALNKSVVDEEFLKKLESGFSFDVAKLPEPFPAPALFITGRQDHILGYRDQWQVLESYPRATFAVLDQAGHLVRGEQEGMWLSLVSEWLDRVEEWVQTGRTSGNVRPPLA